MDKKIYKLVADTFHSHWFRISYLIGFRENAVKELYFDKVTSLAELLDNFENIKTKYKSEFEKFYDLDFIEGFIEEYDKRMHISEKFNGDAILIFSILFGLLVNIDECFNNEISTKNVILKGEKKVENYQKILNYKSLRAEKEINLFIDENSKVDIKQYVYSKNMFLYLPDYIMVAIMLERYATNEGRKNTSLLIKGEKNKPTFFEYAKELYSNKKDFSELTNEEARLLFEKNEKYIKFFELEDVERLGKICDEIIEKIKQDKENNIYFSENIFKVYPNLAYLKSVVSKMNGSLMIPISDFFTMGGQLK